jgi:signal transduction histidine kinase
MGPVSAKDGRVKISARWPYQGIFYLAASFYFAAAFLRSIFLYQDNPRLTRVLVLLVVWLILAASEPGFSARWAGYFTVYLVCQTILVIVLLTEGDTADFYAMLFNILSMQIMARLDSKVGILWILLCGLIMELIFVKPYGNESMALALIYTAGNAFFGSYAMVTRRAQLAQEHNQSFARQVQAANQQLQAYATQLEQMTVVRERNHLARELHDSVTQTVFSMTLATKSAILMLDREPDQVRAQLDRISLLAQGALSEMQLLISKLHPPKVSEAGLVSALRQHLTGSSLFENLSVSLQVTGEDSLSPVEEQGLFRILQEALNNILKHAHASQAYIHLHLEEPFWVEVADQGQGFNVSQALASGGVGLSSMCERAEEIGWDLQISTAPGTGTRIRVTKLPSGGKDR